MGIAFELSKDVFFDVAEGQCVYCGDDGTAYINPSKDAPWQKPYFYTGVDRIDSNGGYVADNVQPCCKWCNKCKNNRTEEEFIDWVRKVAKRWE